MSNQPNKDGLPWVLDIPGAAQGSGVNVTADPGKEHVRQLLQYLVGIAQKTQGAEVWRALFAELYDKHR